MSKVHIIKGKVFVNDEPTIDPTLIGLAMLDIAEDNAHDLIGHLVFTDMNNHVTLIDCIR